MRQLCNSSLSNVIQTNKHYRTQKNHTATPGRESLTDILHLNTEFVNLYTSIQSTKYEQSQQNFVVYLLATSGQI